MALTNNASLKEVIDTFEQINSKIIDRGGTRTITPSTSNQVLLKGNYKGDITIIGDADLKVENIKKGVNIFGKIGTLQTFKKIAGDEKIYIDDGTNY